MTDISEDGGILPPDNGVEPVSISGEMRTAYLDYAMSVIVSRALPDVRDGLKPVHRRILYAMHEAGYTHDKAYRKSARIVGDVIGKYHPHGDSAVYDSLVRMAQEFSLRAPLIDGQGNFGSMDGDPPAAMRYTEVRLEKIAAFLLADIGKSTVDFQENYDSSEREPVVLPARFPNLLVNGAGGIAVGMATNIPPHNLSEVIDAATAMIENDDIDDQALAAIVPGPDFPTGALIVGRSGSISALTTGRGSVIMRALTHFESTRTGRDAIIATELPYQVNKASLIEKIADLARHKRIEGISDIRDESDRAGVRVVIELKRDASSEVVLNQLHRHTPMQTSFGANMLALDRGQPRLMSLREILRAFLAFREEVVTRRARHELDRARLRAHILIGLAVAVANIDKVIAIIRAAPDPAAARAGLLAPSWPATELGALIDLVADRRTAIDVNGQIRLSHEQAQSILDLRLQRLTGLGRGEIDQEAATLATHIASLLALLSSREAVANIVRDELTEIQQKFGQPRRSQFIDADLNLEDEAFIEQEEMVVIFTHRGYVKRTALNAYRTQRRGGKGRSAMGTKDQDFVTRLFVGDTHTELLFFSSTGIVYKQKVWRIPPGSLQSRGKALVNLLPLTTGETITSVVALPEDPSERERLSIVFSTRSGMVRRNRLADFMQVNKAGKIAMKFDHGDGIVDARLCCEDDDVLLTTTLGRCIRFRVGDLRIFSGRSSIGVRGIRLATGDRVIAMTVLAHVGNTPSEVRAYLKQAAAARRAEGAEGAEGAEEAEELDDAAEEVEDDNIDDDDTRITPDRLAALAVTEQFILTVTDNGIGKRASAYDYRTTGRGGKGLIAHRLVSGEKLVASFPVENDDAIILATGAGQMIRCPAEQIRVAGRATQGVRLLRVAADEKVSSVVRLIKQDENDDETETEIATP